MTKSHGQRKVAPRCRKLAESSTGDVGYCRPPAEHQFKPGRSGNPKGRPKGSRNEATIWRSILSKQIAVREGGRQRKVSLLEAMILRFVEDALKGNPKTAAFVLNRYRLAQGNEPETGELDQDDRQILEDFVRRLEGDLKRAKE